MAIQKIICFGFGSNSFEMLNTVSFGVQTSKGWILIDCGPDTPRQIRRAGISFEDIITVVISHSHMDHCLGLPYLIFGRNLELLPKIKAGKKTTNLQVVSQKRVFKELSNLFSTLHPDVTKLSFEISHTDIKSDGDISVVFDAAYIKTIKTEHTVESYGVKIFDTSGISFTYSSDTLPLEAFVKFAKGSTVLALEGMVPQTDTIFAQKTKHSTLTQAAELAKKIGCDKTFLVHLRPKYIKEIQQLENRASEIAGFPISYPKDQEVMFAR